MTTGFGTEQAFALTLFTDAYVIRGQVATRHRRLTDVLNEGGEEFLVLTDVLLDEYGTHSVAQKADYAQVNLASVLFAVADGGVETSPEMRTPKIPEQALISIPPFKIVGRIHLMPEARLRDALQALKGRFVPVTDGSYWSETVGEAKTSADIIAFNHSRAQILAPHRVVDPWEGINRGEAASPAGTPVAEGLATGKPDALSGVVDPWGRPGG
ncbi:MAG TPA: hypothetical protein VGC90_11185 [Candidatus Limnocylindrales bacterium]|jgi:hypothetical protein